MQVIIRHDDEVSSGSDGSGVSSQRFGDYLSLTTNSFHMISSQSQSQSHVTTDGQSVGLSWCLAPSGSHDQIIIISSTVLHCIYTRNGDTESLKNYGLQPHTHTADNPET
jgi:hypothetical protein